jgi:lipopolysaccharide export system protein LptA
MLTVLRILSVAIVAIALFAVNDARAQSTATGVPNAMQGFRRTRQADSDRCRVAEMRDKDKAATFSGNVKVVQGDTTMLCKTLVVFYDNDQSGKKSAMKSATPGPAGSSSIKRLEAQGGVTVTQKDSTVTGDRGVFDMRTNTVTMHGNVLLTKDKNVLRGDRLVVDLTTGVSRVESNSGRAGRVQAAPSSAQQGGNGGGAQPPGAPGKPLKLNDLPNMRKRNGVEPVHCACITRPLNISEWARCSARSCSGNAPGLI